MEAGADLAIDYKNENVADALLDFAPEGVNVYWDATPSPDAKSAVDVLADRGRMVFIAGRITRRYCPPASST